MADTLTFDTGHCLYPGDYVALSCCSKGYQFKQVNSVDSATCFTMIPVSFWKLLKMTWYYSKWV